MLATLVDKSQDISGFTQTSILLTSYIPEQVYLIPQLTSKRWYRIPAHSILWMFSPKVILRI